MKKISFLLLVCCFLLSSHMVMAEEGKRSQDPSLVTLQILETTDLHAQILDYDYNKRQSTIEFGLNRTASLIKKAREHNPNTLLFDVGDSIKGNALSDYIVDSKFFFYTDVHPVYKSMNLLHYDAATPGNHEFNDGLDFLVHSIMGANFPFTNANIYVEDHNDYEDDDITFFSPYLIINKEVINQKGEKEHIKVGIIGLITPVTAQWDKVHFQDKLKIKNMSETAKKMIPKMKQDGADIIIALVHAGLESDMELKEKEGNNVRDISKIDGIDVILFGHSHQLFPIKGEKNSKTIHHKSGKINGKPAVQAGYWGNHLGMVQLTLKKENDKWKIIQSISKAQPIIRIIKDKKIPVVEPYEPINRLMEPYHQETLQYMQNRKK